jgi:hypothetical protein
MATALNGANKLLHFDGKSESFFISFHFFIKHSWQSFLLFVGFALTYVSHKD